MNIRLLEYKDMETIFQWRVDPETIIWTKSNNLFSKSTHIDWFKKRLESLDSHPMVILEINSLPIGYVRFDKQVPCNSLYEVSIFLDVDFRHKRLGSLALSASLNFLNLNSASLIARIHIDNKKSIKFFEREGFLFSAQFENFLTYSRGPVLLDAQ